MEGTAPMVDPEEIPISDFVPDGKMRRTFDLRHGGAGLVILTPQRAGAAAAKAVLQYGFALSDVVFDSRGSDWVLLIANGNAVNEASAALEKQGYVRTHFQNFTGPTLSKLRLLGADLPGCEAQSAE